MAIDIEVDLFDRSSVEEFLDAIDELERNILEGMDRLKYGLVDVATETARQCIDGFEHADSISFRSEDVDRETVDFIASGDEVTVEWYKNKELQETKSEVINPLFIAEFGSGHLVENLYMDKAPQMVEGAISYSEQGYGQVSKKRWSYIPLDTGMIEYSEGVAPVHPIYNAVQSIQNEFERVARESFEDLM